MALPCDSCAYSKLIPTGFITCEFNWDRINFIAKQPIPNLNFKVYGHLYHFPYNFNPELGPDICVSYMLKTRRDILESQLSFLLSLDEESEVCSLCNFPRDLHDDLHHDYTGWNVLIAVDKLSIELRSCA